MNDTVLAEAGTELRAMARSRRLWLGLISASALIGLTGPFGTYDLLGLPARLAYWAGVTPAAWWLAAPLSLLTTLWAERRGLGPPILCAAVGGAAAGAALTVPLALLHGALFGEAMGGAMLRLAPYVIAISVAVAALTEALEATWQDVEAAPRAAGGAADTSWGAEAASAEAEDWLSRLPPHLGRALILIQSQDHYLRVETTRGEALIRGRLSEAADALGPLGVRVHRSWWAARGQVAALRHRGGAPVAVLRDGRELPVGRTWRRNVREALRGA